MHAHHQENKLNANAYEILGIDSGAFGQGTLGTQVIKCSLEVGHGYGTPLSSEDSLLYGDLQGLTRASMGAL